MAQIFALDSVQRLISIYNAKNQEDYTCRECGGILRTRGGIHRQRHFFHLQLSPTCQQSEKSLEHLQVQYYLMSLLPEGECFLERQFSKKGRIADVVWEPKKLVFEVQCSGISKEEVENRNLDYAALGYQVIWLFHDKHFNRYKVSAAESAVADLPHYYTNIDKGGRGMIYDQIEVLHGGLRNVFLTLPEVALNAPQEPICPIPIRRKWTVYFSLDLTDRWKKKDKGVGEALLKAQIFKQRSNRLMIPFFQSVKTWYHGLVVRPYLALFQMLLEKACR